MLGIFFPCLVILEPSGSNEEAVRIAVRKNKIAAHKKITSGELNEVLRLLTN